MEHVNHLFCMNSFSNGPWFSALNATNTICCNVSNRHFLGFSAVADAHWRVITSTWSICDKTVLLNKVNCNALYFLQRTHVLDLLQKSVSKAFANNLQLLPSYSTNIMKGPFNISISWTEKVASYQILQMRSVWGWNPVYRYTNVDIIKYQWIS